MSPNDIMHNERVLEALERLDKALLQYSRHIRRQKPASASGTRMRLLVHRADESLRKAIKRHHYARWRALRALGAHEQAREHLKLARSVRLLFNLRYKS